MSVPFEKLPRYLTPREVAGLLRISMSSFYLRAHRGAIPVIKMGGSLRVDKKALERFLEQQTRGNFRGL